jgi:SAM-dependent methyltransferase
MLTPEQDAYGRMIHDHLLGIETDEIVERDDGYVDTSGGPTAYFAAFAEWPEHQRLAMRHLAGPVLDVGAGAGRVSLYAQEHGHKVLATDISPLAIETCKARGVKRARVVPITQLGPDLGTFRTVVMYGNNFGLFGNKGRARWLLARFRHFTTPDARILAESCDPYKTTSPEHHEYQAQNRARGRMSGQIKIRVRYRKIATPWFEYLLASRNEVEEIVDGTGWTLEETFEGSGSGPYALVIRRTR